MRIWRSRHNIEEAATKRERRRRKNERRSNAGRRELFLERFEDRLLLAGPQLVSIVPNDSDVLIAGQTRHTAPRELIFRFDQNQNIDPATLGAITIARAGFDSVLGTVDDVTVVPGFRGIGDRPNDVIVRFAETLPDDIYRINILDTGPGALATLPIDPGGGEPIIPGELFTNTGPVRVPFDFRLDLAPQVVAVVPQPISRDAFGNLVQSHNTIEVYFNDDDLQPLPLSPSNLDPKVFQLIRTGNTATTTDDETFAPAPSPNDVFRPVSVAYFAAEDKAILTFAVDLENMPGTGAFRLRIGNDETPMPQPIVTTVLLDPGSTFGDPATLALDPGPFDAGNLNEVGHRIFEAAIEPQPLTPGLLFPGGLDEPGHRDIPAESHLIFGGDSTPGVIPVLTYNFPDVYGGVPGNPILHNVITAEQRELARQIFGLYAHYLGVQFVEMGTDVLGDASFAIITGLVQAADPSLPATLPGVADGTRAIMNASIFQDESQYAGGWFQTAMHEIGHLLGLGHSFDLPPLTVQGSTGGTAEGVFPGDHDIAHGQFLYRRESKDIDLYEFIVTTPGTFSAETVAERLAPTSLLNSALTLYDEVYIVRLPQTGDLPIGSNNVIDGHRFTIDDGIVPAITFEFDRDNSVVETSSLRRIAFSVTNTAHDVAVSVVQAVNNAAALFGLTVTAEVEFDRVVLRGPIRLTPGANPGTVTYPIERQVAASNDDYFSQDAFIELALRPGRYYVAVTSTGNTQFNPNVADSGFGGNTQGGYDLRLEFQPQATVTDSLTDRITTPRNVFGEDDATILDGDSDGVPGGVHNFWFDVGHTIFVDKLAAGAEDPGDHFSLGSIDNPFNEIDLALTTAGSRIIAAPGTAINEGDTFLVDDGIHNPVTFEFDTDGILEPGNVAVQYSTGSPAFLIAFNIFSAVQAQALLPEGSPNKLTLNVFWNGDTLVDLELSQRIDLRGTPALIDVAKMVRIVGNTGPENSLGVRAAPGIVDGQSFRISSGTNSVVFEFDSNASVVQTASLRRVAFTASSTAAQIAAAMAAAINASVLNSAQGGRVTATVVTSAAGSRVDLRGLGTILIDALLAPSLDAASNARAYEIGFSQFAVPLVDGSDMVVPQAVTVVIDAGAVFKLREANIDVGLSSPNIDRSRAALQALGVPGRSVVFTSHHDNTYGRVSDAPDLLPSRGNWGGIVFRGESDREDQAVFLNYVGQSLIRFGGGQVTVDATTAVYNPIHMQDARPTIAHNTITSSADAAMSANPNSFEETLFGTSAFGAAPYSTDYSRVGPEIHGNRLSVAQPGPIVMTAVDGSQLVDEQTFVVNGTRFEFNDAFLPVPPTVPPVDPANVRVDFFFFSSDTQVAQAIATAINGVPGLGVIATASGNQVILRNVSSVDVETSPLTTQSPLPLQNTINGLFVRATSLPGQEPEKLEVSARFDDTSIVHVISENLFIRGTAGGAFDPDGPGPLAPQARTDARLAIDAGVIVKLGGSRIEVQNGGTLLAEGRSGTEVVLTSNTDDRFGAGGTFDTNDNSPLTPGSGAAGNWAGLFFGPTSRGAIDHALVTFAGGASPIEGDIDNFNPIDIRQADVRIANSTFQSNAGGQAVGNRTGRGTNQSANIFVQGAQPIIVNNIFLNNEGATISVNVNALSAQARPDTGRSTGPAEMFTQFADNQGPLVRLNRIGNDPAILATNGLVVRGGTLTTEGVWDDRDIVHVVFDEIIVSNFHTSGGLRLASSPTESLVVKMQSNAAGLTASGLPLDITDRIGGSVHILGTASHPVIITSLGDQSSGAGLTPEGLPQNDTANVGPGGVPSGGGNSGPVFIDGGDRDDVGHGSFDGTNNIDGWKFIEQAVNFAHTNSRNAAGTGILVIGADPAGQAGDAITSVGAVLGLPLTFITGAQISTENFALYKIIYVPSDLNTGGGITDADIALLTARKTDIQNYVNLTGGGLVALTEASSATPYSWLELPDPFTIDTGGGGANLMQTPLLAAAGFNITDAELNGGTPWHNSFTGPPGFNNLQVWVVSTLGEVVTLGLPAGSAGIGARPTEWRSVRLERYSNDRNVAAVLETENAFTGGRDVNNTAGTSGTAQPLGRLAPDEKSGDDKLRLGFDIHGSISYDDPTDVDIYTFQARGGTEIWLDIDGTTHSLDTVVELIDANGTVLARSNDSVSETAQVLSGLVQGNLARVMRRDVFLDDVYPATGERDYGTTNPRDAGMRLVLPGQSSNTPNTYYVRVRSNSANLNVVKGGVSTGAYQLQIRLRELDESAGSTIEFSDIRFATNGIEILGLPGHSPLVGESAELATDTADEGQGAALNLGNLLGSDRNTISVAGALASSADVDWYQFTVDYDFIQSIASINDGGKTWSTVFDIDYADGLSRADTVISVFDSAGNLVLVSRDSNISEDQPGPGGGANLNDLSRGSAGKLDAYIGAVQLPEANGRTYFVAVHSNATLPSALNGTFTGAGASTLVRLEPIDSVRRIIEDHVGFQGGQSADTPIPLFNGDVNNIATLNAHATAFTLSDVVLFVNTPGAAGRLHTVDPFSGAAETDIGDMQDPSRGYNDLAMRNDGRLFGFSIGTTDGNSGNFNQINTGNATAVTAGEDGIVTYQIDPADPTSIITRDTGIQFDALSFVESGTTRRLFAVGRYGGGFGVPAQRNLFYELDPNTGVALNITGNATLPTDPAPAVLSTTVDGGPGGTVTGMAEVNGVLYAVSDAGGLYTVSFGTGNPNPARLNYVGTSAAFVGTQFTGLTRGPIHVENGRYANLMFATSANGRLHAFDTAGAPAAIFAGGATSIPLGITGAVGLAFSTLDFNLWHATDRRGTEAGHGINPSFDNSRTNLTDEQQEGGLSYYFGYENRPAGDPIRQFDVDNYGTNTGIYNTYDFPGGAAGSLTTNAFSLSGYAYEDKPTLYFNYFVQTERDGGDPMFDSARVFVSNDNGANWSMLATNNSASDTELPEFITTSSRVGFGGGLGQRVQELFDDVSPADGIGWRQARVDLGDFVGQSNLVLRFDFSTAGDISDPSSPRPVNPSLPGDQFGQFDDPRRGQANAFEGFYIDDIIVGFAERGEMVTGASPGTGFFTVPQNTDPGAPTQILTGRYQLEIRRGEEYGATISPTASDIALFRSFDTNDRLTQAFTLIAPTGRAVADGQTFTISDGLITVTFEFDSGGGTRTGNTRVPFSVTDTAQTIARSMRDAINAHAALKVDAATVQNSGVTTGITVELIGATDVGTSNTPPIDLTVNVASPLVISENGGSTTATVTREGPISVGITVVVTAIDVVTGLASDEVTLGGSGTSTTTVVIPANSAISPSFVINGLDDSVVDGTQTVKLVASAAGFNSVSDTLDVTDDESPTLTLVIAVPSVINEADGAAAISATVSRNVVTNRDLDVTLLSLDPSEASVQTTVRILANQASATFNINAVNDLVIDGTQTVTIVAFAAGFIAGTDTLDVLDDGLDTIAVGTPIWVAQGPAPNTGGQVENIIPDDEITGAIHTVLAHPTNANILYAGAVNGGIWRTTNALSTSPTWTPLTDTQASLSMGALEFDPTDFTRQTLIAGIGRFSSFGQAGGSLTGLLRSTNGGTTWTAINPAVLQGQNISGVAARGSILLASANSMTGSGGLFRSIDGGLTFTPVTAGLALGPVSDLVADPSNANRFYAAVLGQGLFRSDDAGANWTNVTPAGVTFDPNPFINNNIEMAVHGTTFTNAVYVGIMHNGQLSNFLRSDNLGVTWTAMDIPQTNEGGVVIGIQPRAKPGAQGAIHFSVVADPANQFLVYVGGDRQPLEFSNPTSSGATDFSGRLFRGNASLAAGSQWTPLTHIGTISNSSPHADSREMVFDATGSIIEGDDGGIYRRTSPRDSNGDWFSINGNLQVTEFHNIEYDSNTNTLIGGAQDTGTPEQVTQGGLRWRSVSTADGGDVLVDDSDPAQSIRYSSFQFLGAFRRRTYDLTNTLISEVFPPLLVNGTGGLTFGQVDGGQFTTPLELNAVDPTRLVIAGFTSVFESLDRGDTLVNLNGPGQADAMAYGGRLNNVDNPAVLWVGSGSSLRLRTVQGGSLAATSYSGAAIRDIVLDPDDWRVAYVANSGNRIFRTINGGSSFQDVTGNLATLTSDFRSIQFVPGSPNDAVVVGTKDGLFRAQINISGTLGTWSRYGALLPNVPLYDLAYDPSDNILVAGTLGRGAFGVSAIAQVGDLVVQIIGSRVISETDPNPATQARISRTGTSGDIIVQLFSTDTSEATLPATVLIPDGQSSVIVDIDVVDDSLVDGTQTVVIRASAFGFDSIADVISVTDDESPELTVVVLPTSVLENAGFGSVTGVVTRNTDTTEDLVVSLLSSDTSEATVLASVVIPAGQASALFNITPVDEFVSDSVRTVIITAAASGFLSGADSLNVVPVDNQIFYDLAGDQNLQREQGQITIKGSTIDNSLDFGIVIDSGTRDAGGNLPHPGPVRNTFPVNTNGWVPGVTVENNVLLRNGDGGILFSGDANPAGTPAASVPFGRIVNNTIIGRAALTGTKVGVGLRVNENSSPTILNNIFANLATGIEIDATSASAVISGNIYQRNTTNRTGGTSETFIFNLADDEALFTDLAKANLYLESGSKAIDSSIQSLAERSALSSVKIPLGIPGSPILAPDRDILGQLRVDDPTADPLGVGASVFKDRGAIERADFAGATAVLLNPRDNDLSDQDPRQTTVRLLGATLSDFAVQLLDGVGSGIDDSTVSFASFTLRRNGILLQPGVDYIFSYDTNNQVVRFISTAGIWLNGNQFTITADNGVLFDPLSGPGEPGSTPVGIRDLAGNLLQANNPSGRTEFNIILDGIGNDAPVMHVPGLQTMNEDALGGLVFSTANRNLITLFDVDAGANDVQLTLTTAAAHTLTLPSSLPPGLVVSGNGTNVLTITGTLIEINAVLDGLVFRPGLNFNGLVPNNARIDLTANDLGNFPAPARTGTASIDINVLPVNDAPVNIVPLVAQVTPEDTSIVFSTARGNRVAVSDVDITNPSDATTPVRVTLAGTNGTITLAGTAGLTFTVGDGTADATMTFSGTIADINTALDGMSFRPTLNFNGAALLRITTNDQGNVGQGVALSDVDTITITVLPVNDPPFVAAPIADVTVNEDAPPRSINLSGVFADPDSPPDAAPTLSVAGNDNPALVTATLSGSTLTLTFKPNQNGIAQITIRATDAFGLSVTDTFRVTVLPVQDPPTAIDDDEFVYQVNTPLQVALPGVLANDVDPDGDPLTAILFDVPDHGKLTLSRNGSFTYTPDPNFNGRDRFVYMADDGQGNRTPATVTLNSLESRFVERMYIEIIGRTRTSIADAEINFWLAQMAAGMTRTQVAEAFVASTERRTAVINQLYLQYLGRTVDPAGLAFWLNEFARARGPEPVQIGIIGSLEFFNRAGGTPQLWVQALYQNILGRGASPSEVAFWTGFLQTHTREDVVTQFITSDEYRRDVVIRSYYTDFLHREIEPDGANFWLAQVKAGLPLESILSGILGSDEYLRRA